VRSVRYIAAPLVVSAIYLLGQSSAHADDSISPAVIDTNVAPTIVSLTTGSDGQPPLVVYSPIQSNLENQQPPSQVVETTNQPSAPSTSSSLEPSQSAPGSGAQPTVQQTPVVDTQQVVSQLNALSNQVTVDGATVTTALDASNTILFTKVGSNDPAAVAAVVALPGVQSTIVAVNTALHASSEANATAVTAIQTAVAVVPQVGSATATVAVTQAQVDTAIATVASTTSAVAGATEAVAQTSANVATKQTALDSATTALVSANQAVTDATTAVQVATDNVTNSQNTLTTIQVAQPALDAAAACTEGSACVSFYTKNAELGPLHDQIGSSQASSDAAVVAAADAVVANQAAEGALNAHTPIVIAAQQANADARTANDVAQAAVAPANQAVATQQVVVTQDVTTVATAQAAATASAAPGLNVTVYSDPQYAAQPPVGAGTIVRTTTTSNINYQWGNGSVMGGPSDRVQVKFEGNITSDTTGNVQFYAPADDGTKLYINNTLVINDWRDKGGGGSQSAPVAFTANEAKPITLWFYENGGGASVSLYWYKAGSSGYTIVPSSAFSRGNVDPTLAAAVTAAQGTLQVDQATLDTLVTAANTAQANANAALTNYTTVNQAMAAAEAAQAPIQQAAWDTRAAVQTTAAAVPVTAQAVVTAQAAYDAKLAERNAAWDAYTSAIHAASDNVAATAAAQAAYDQAQINLDTAKVNLVNAQDAAGVAQSAVVTVTTELQTSQSVLDSANQNLTVVSQNLTTAQSILAETSHNLVEAQGNLTNVQSQLEVALTSALQATDTATVTAAAAVQALNDGTAKIVAAIDLKAQQDLEAAQALAKKQADDALAATLAAQAAAQALADQQAAADAAARALALANSANQQPQPEPQPSPAASEPEPAPADPVPAEPAPDQPSDAPNAPADQPAPADNPAPDQPQDTPSANPDPTQQPDPGPAPKPDPAPEPEPAPAPAPDPAPAPEPAPIPEPAPAPEPPAVIVVNENTTAETWVPAVAPETYMKPEEIQAYKEIGIVPNNAAQLPTDVPKPAPAEVLVPHIQVDVTGVENGGIQFFGTQSAPQVVTEDGKLTPPAPPPGSGLPIPADAITIADTFIGQPGGTTFNAPDVAVPVIETPVTGAIAAVPGVQALNHAFVAMSNIGNDMSPVTRKKAKKILVLTVAVAAVVRRKFGR